MKTNRLHLLMQPILIIIVLHREFLKRKRLDSNTLPNDRCLPILLEVSICPTELMIAEEPFISRQW